MTRLNKDRLITECGCGDPEHLLVFQYYQDEDEGAYKSDGHWDELYVHFTSNCYWGLWKRIKLALRYVFRKESFLLGDVVIFNHSNINQLEEACQFLRDRVLKSLENNPRE